MTTQQQTDKHFFDCAIAAARWGQLPRNQARRDMDARQYVQDALTMAIAFASR
jgi:hypothetical protein